MTQRIHCPLRVRRSPRAGRQEISLYDNRVQMSVTCPRIRISDRSRKDTVIKVILNICCICFSKFSAGTTVKGPPRGKESGQICHGRRESGQICHGRKTTWGTVNHSLFRKDRDIYYRRFIFKLPQEVSSSASTDSEFWPGLEAFPVGATGVPLFTTWDSVAGSRGG